MKILRLIPVVLLAWNALADEPGGQQPDPQRPQPPPVAGPPVEGCAQAPCYNPRANYWCELGCPDPEPPFRPEVLEPYVPPGAQVIVRPRGYGYGGGYGGYIGPRPMPHGGFGGPQVAPYRRMSFNEGCELQQGNSGEFAVLSNFGDVIYLDSTAHAAENAAYMKTYYEKKSKLGLCASGATRSTWGI